MKNEITSLTAQNSSCSKPQRQYRVPKTFISLHLHASPTKICVYRVANPYNRATAIVCLTAGQLDEKKKIILEYTYSISHAKK